MRREGYARPLGDWVLAGEACVRLVAASLTLRLLPFRWVAGTLFHSRARTGNSEWVERTAWAVDAATRHLPWRPTCLRRAFATSWMLQARGFSPQLLYGVAKVASNAFQAHAWVEVDGRPVIGRREAESFTLLAVLPMPQPTH